MSLEMDASVPNAADPDPDTGVHGTLTNQLAGDAESDGHTVHAPAIETTDADDPTVRHFRLVALTVVGASSLYLAWFVRSGRLGIGYQGDEGLRVFDAYQNAFQLPNREHGGVLDSAIENMFGIHPPGDNLVRSSVAWVLDLLGWGAGPVTTMFLLSIGAVAIAHLLAAEVARRAAGTTAGYLALFLLLGSYVFNDVKVSSMGEAMAVPLLLASLFVLTRFLGPAAPPIGVLVGSAALFAASTFMRPEVSLLLPGLCLALWALIGFRRAALFGAVAGSFEFAKLVNSSFFATESDLSLLNVGSRFFNGKKDLGQLWRTDFIQQLIREPGMLVFVIGTGAVLAMLFASRDRDSLAWRTQLLLSASVASYLSINIASQMLGLSPHAAYRIVTVIAPVMVIAFAIAFVDTGGRVLPPLEARFGDRLGSSILFAFFVVVCAWGSYVFFTDRVDELADRVPAGVRATADEVLARSQPEDGIFVDQLRYWNGAMIGYFADRDAPVCIYSRCALADDTADEMWRSLRDDEPERGTRTWGEFSALRAHLFISEQRPAHIVLASEDIYRDWMRVASGLWGADAELWGSHIFPYLDGETDFDAPTEQFLRLGTIDGVEYFDEWVLLIPRSKNDLGIVFQAFYGRTPEGVS